MRIVTSRTTIPKVTLVDQIKAETELEMGDSERFEESYGQKLARERQVDEMMESIISASERLAKTLAKHPLMTTQQRNADGSEVSRNV